jgi:microsomal dipeptidase-like Zn-dependent dipeptidase
MEAVDLQIDAAKEMEAYIDGQAGGSGKGWFRIAYTPEQARQIILNGKLAVVLGIEVDKLFGCGKDECDANKVDTELARYYGKGVRHLFPVHLADNAFGGFALTGEDLFKLNSTLTNPGGAFGPGVNDANCSSRGFDRPCNTRTLTQLGAHLIRSMMNKGMIIDIDHMGMHTTDDVLALTGPRKYPVVSGHTGFVGTADAGHSSEREKSDGWLADINKDGGMVSVGMSANAAKSYTPSWRGAVANTCPGTTRTMAQSYLYAVDKMGGPDNAAVGLATDQFLTNFAAPRFDGHCPGENPATKVTYPMATRSGQYLGASKAGNRTFDYNTEGLAHFGLLPELIQDLKNEGLTDRDLDPLFRSAEGYIRMWERAVASVPVP